MSRLFFAVLVFVCSLATGTINAATIQVHASQSATFHFNIPAIEHPIVIAGINFYSAVTGVDGGDTGAWTFYSEINGMRSELYSHSEVSPQWLSLTLSEWDGGVLSAVLTISSGEVSVDPSIDLSLFFEIGLCPYPLGSLGSLNCLLPRINQEMIYPSSVSIVSEPSAISIFGLGLLVFGLSRVSKAGPRKSKQNTWRSSTTTWHL